MHKRTVTCFIIMINVIDVLIYDAGINCHQCLLIVILYEMKNNTSIEQSYHTLICLKIFLLTFACDKSLPKSNI